ncbi:MAG: HU family DNA-binding protein, partial [Gammaproteobacteria bacterium]|nr:HU family DNA-binding protein [Gammaproteobacteria bacterium]
MATKKKSVKKVVKAKKATPAKKSLKTKTKTVAATKKVTKKAVKKPVKKVAKKAVKKVAKKSVRKVATKKTTETVAKKALPKLALAKKMYSKSELYRAIGAHVGITKKQVAEVFDMLGEVVHSHLKSGAVGVLKLEGLLKIEKIRKPAKK